jgi:cytochrome c
LSVTVTSGPVSLSIDYVSEGFDVAAVTQGQHPVDPTTRFGVAKALIAKYDCAFCHNRDNRTVGPTFKELAGKYQPDEATLETLAAKVRVGGSGNWGTVPMPSHPLLPVNDAKTIISYFLSTNDQSIGTLPLTGAYTPSIPQGDNGRGTVLIHAVYTDKGAGQLPAQTAEALTVLRNPTLDAGTADVQVDVLPQVGRNSTANASIVAQTNGYIAFKAIDMNGVKALAIAALAGARASGVGGSIEIHLDSALGTLVGEAIVPVAATPPQGSGRGAAPAPPLTADLTPTSGVHNLYLVFKNDRANARQALMTVSTIVFVQ